MDKNRSWREAELVPGIFNVPTTGSLGIQLITPHLYLFDPCGIVPSVAEAERCQLGLTVIHLSDTSGADSHQSSAKINKGNTGKTGKRKFFIFYFPSAKLSCIKSSSINKTGWCSQVCWIRSVEIRYKLFINASLKKDFHNSSSFV